MGLPIHEPDAALHLRGARWALRQALGIHECRATKLPQGALFHALRVARPLVPYVIHPTKIGHIWLNRDYKPLGMAVDSSLHWVRYEGFPSMLVQPLEATAKAVAHITYLQPFQKFGVDGDMYFLFDDLTAPWEGRHHALALLEKVEKALALAAQHQLATQGVPQPAA